MIAILLPSYERINELEKVLNETELGNNAKFIVVANYREGVFNSLCMNYANRAVFINERQYGKLGASKAYNIAYQHAVEHGYTYAILFADDVIPFDKNWLDQIDLFVRQRNHVFGVFSSDECHHGSFGWNIVKECPIAHFFIIKCGLIPELFDSRYRQYVIDLDVSVRVRKLGHSIALLPIRMNHFRSGLHREAMGENFTHDVAVFYGLHPEYRGWLNNRKSERYIRDAGQLICLQPETASIKTVRWGRSFPVIWFRRLLTFLYKIYLKLPPSFRRMLGGRGTS